MSAAKHWTILKNWENKGVICLQIFNRICDGEAFIRETSMIEAITLPKSTNKKRGTFYAPSNSWSQEKRQIYGVHNLKRAYKIFKNERIVPFYGNEA
uniref:Uncharacterized protein n=1 Tax=Panagrolaimus sp. PS1159 TaxID=55785 RepID=A0AC35GB39_9BILA